MAFKTVGIRTSIWNNNAKSTILLFILPATLMGMVWAIIHILLMDEGQNLTSAGNWDLELKASAIVIGLVALWYAIAYFFQEKMTMKMAGATKVDRRTCPGLYNLTENLAITAGIKMPHLYMIESEQLNAFASGIDINKSAICVTKGLVKKLNKKELEAVLAHEMTHILHRDVRLLTIAILFTNVIAVMAEIFFRGLSGSGRSRSKGGKNAGAALLVIAAIFAIGYLIAILSKFAISRKREYMADAGAVVLTKDKDAMISALEKISGKSEIKKAESDLRYMLFDNQVDYLGLFRTHPSIKKRIDALRNF